MAALTPPLTTPAILVMDACVMMSGLQRRLMLALGACGLFQPAWSERIGDEWMRNARRLWDIPAENLQADWDAMQSAFPGAMAHEVDEYKQGLRYSDPKDWHVIAVAREMRERHPDSPVEILTLNLKDFNRSELRRLGLSALTPDRKLAAWWPMHETQIHQAIADIDAVAPPPGRPRVPMRERLGRERMLLLRRLMSD
ncbi:PIN domain-containing protein [Castellaniella hirudinis]|uniref:PIN domain-containing protein n=1 Tax=Castellaniella hirudinis TaxID=1144617 RepID=A0ABV8S179_9BURK